MSKRPVPTRESGLPNSETTSAIGWPANADCEVAPRFERWPSGDDLRATVGRNFRLARRHARLTQVEVAKQIGSAASYIVTIERGDANLTLGMLARLAAVVGVAPSALILSPPPEPQERGPLEHLIAALQTSINLLQAVQTASEANLGTMKTVLSAMLESTQRPG